MVFSVDFHIRDILGRIVAPVEGSQAYSLEPGELALAEDDEGNRSKVIVEEIAPTRGIAFLSLVAGTTEPSPMVRQHVQELLEAADFGSGATSIFSPEEFVADNEDELGRAAG